MVLAKEYSLLTAEDLARRWKCSIPKIRNTNPHQLPPRVRIPGSRLVRFRLEDVKTFEKQHVRSATEAAVAEIRKTFRRRGRPRMTRSPR